MPMPDQMGLALSPVQKTTLLAALQTVLTTMNGVKVVQLSPAERQAAQTVSEIRRPYVQNAIQNLAPSFTNLQPPFMLLANAQNDLKSMNDFVEVNNLMREVFDRCTDFAMASEHFAYEYMRKFYTIAKEGQSVNTPGADTVVAALAPLFEQQGSTNPTPPGP